MNMVGKLPPNVLEREVLRFRGASRSDVLVGPGVGEDAALIKFSSEQPPFLAVSSDPIVGASAGAGRLLVHINANDIACKGGEPSWFIVTLIVPVKDGLECVKGIMSEIHETCLKLGVSVVGGHTELTDRYQQPVIVGTMMGKTDYLLDAASIRAGDSIIMTQHAGLEGLSIIAHDRPDLLSFLSESEIDEVRLWSNKLSVLDASRAIRDIARFMHDPTEGGVMGGLFEFCRMSGLGIDFEKGSIPVSPITLKVSHEIGFDPLHLISSGVLLAAVPGDMGDEAVCRLERKGIPAQIIGNVVAGKDNVMDTHEELWDVLKRGGKN